MPSADLYLDKIDFRRYFDGSTCEQCGFSSCEAFVEAVGAGVRNPLDCSFITRNQASALEAMGKIKELWPPVPLLMHPRPAFTGLLELNGPSSDSLVLVTGNNEYTEEVLMTVMGTTVCPFYVLFVNTEGNTVDMAMVYQTLTAEGIARAIREAGGKLDSRDLIIPGLAAPLRNDIENVTGCRVRVGPVCAAELPLFLSEMWVKAE